jgi:phosphoribosylanthranilate isomerase
MFIKICGITRPEDGKMAIEAGADALGFVFEPRSPRHLPNRPNWQQWVATLEDAPRVLVMANPVHLPAEWTLFDAIQCNWQEGVPPESFRASLPPLPLWLALRVKSEDTAETVLTTMQTFAPFVERFVLDTYHPEQPGGTGATHDWARARQICAAAPRPVLLAGGLTPENVAEAIRQVQPNGVDVSSGVEAAPGIKDAARIQQFIQAARSAP